jgi:hypothetical protein
MKDTPTTELVTRAVEYALDAALGEVHRQVGEMGHVLKEARGAGMDAAQLYIDQTRIKIRGEDFACEECGKLQGSHLDNGWYRCSNCGYPSK